MSAFCHAVRYVAVAICLGMILVLNAPVDAVAQTPEETSAEAAVDPFGRTSPRGLMSGLVDSLAEEDYVRASNFLDLSGIPVAQRAIEGPAYAKRFKTLLDNGGRIDNLLGLSDQEAGNFNDSLPPNEERVGSIPLASGILSPVVATSVTEDDVTVWRVSRQTLAAMPTTVREAAWRQQMPAFLSQTLLLGAPLVDWLVLATIAAVVFGLMRLSFSVVLLVLGRFRRDSDVRRFWRIVDAGAAPLSLFLTITFFLRAASEAGVSIVARMIVGQFVVGLFFVALIWLIWRMVDVGSEIMVERMDRHERRRAKSAILFAKRAAKFVLIAVAIIAVLATVGINVTAGLAALGIGGIALALGAQKTIENIVGSVSVIADELVRVGDFCRIGDVTGTIEDIGIRSTRIRTSERTRVTIPNGSLAAMTVENYAMRDRFLFNPTLALASNLDADGIMRVLTAIREAFDAFDFVSDDARVNFKGFGSVALEFETFAYLGTADATQAASLREQLLLEIMRKVVSAGGAFFSPSVVEIEDRRAADRPTDRKTGLSAAAPDHRSAPTCRP